ncbi:PhoX family phosphatase [Methyloversatilis sp.]|uniref:PhoX family protein n=1 Tax=Methyloversatilis sp. TaxID=2569862 RepID=UPI0027B92A24|nr:alkaline phosphatase PhoX [Methyloversatilis sp.]
MTTRDDLIDTLRDFAKTDAAKEMDPHWTYGRRGFMKSSVAAAATVAMPFGLLGSGRAHAAKLPYSPDYGPLAPVADQTTGLPLLQLPEGFTYSSFGWTGDIMNDGIPTPSNHDGMAVIASDASKVIIGRNHERGRSVSYAPAKITYDPTSGGGTTNMMFSPRTGQWVGAWATLGGTIRNCAGGPTPWNSWITCEETTDGTHNGSAKQHGYCFDVPASGAARPVPLVDMGCFSHEAVAVDPVTGYIYETEDSTPSGLYRFIPNVPGRLEMGGKLQMMKLKTAFNAERTINGTVYGYYNTAVGQTPGATFDVEWVDIDEPNKPFISGTSYGGVVAQGLVQGASSISRGEGIWYGNGVIYVCSTNGGAARKGQIFAYDPRRETFALVYESAGGVDDVDGPDNIAWSPRGSLILCEDGGGNPKELYGLTLDGTHFKFAQNNANFSATGFGAHTRPSGVRFSSNSTGSEFVGATFHNEWLFVGIQSPGITYAITGPWDNGAL